MKNLIFHFLLIIMYIGCNEQTNEPTVTPNEQWKANNIHNYTIDQTRSCFCLSGGEKMRLLVYSDTLHSVMKLSDSTMLPFNQAQWYLSIDSLFNIIRFNKQDSLIYTFDSRYGFPTVLDINPQQHPYDGGVLIESNNLQPIH